MICDKQDIRLRTVLVIEKDGKYLSRKETVTGTILWDQHLSSAWRTRNKGLAELMVAIHGGNLVLFNPIVWRVKAL